MAKENSKQPEEKKPAAKKPAAKKPEAKIHEAPQTAPTPQPKKIRLTSPFGFYDDDGLLTMWQANQEIIDHAEIKTLMDACAEYQTLE